MAKLENHSGFDRDSADWNNLNKVAPTSAPEKQLPSPSIEQRKAEIERMKANIARLQESNDELIDERISAGVDYEMHDSFDPPHERLERAWVAPDAIEVGVVEVEQSHPLADKFDRIESLLEEADIITVKDIQKKLKISTSEKAQQLAQMFCFKNKSRYRFGQKANPNGTVSYFIESVA